MSNVAVIAKITCQEGKRDDAVALFTDFIEYVKASEPGTLIYALNTDAKDANVVWFYELYADADALKAHGSSDAMKAMGGKLAACLAGRPEVTVVNPVAAKGL